MKNYVYKMKPLSSFHLGKGDAGGKELESTDDLIHSDTLFSALLINWKKLYGDADLDNVFFSDNPKFIISSAFHYYKNLIFFPKPRYEQSHDLIDSDNNLITGKKIKKIKYVSQSIFNDYLAGNKSMNISDIETIDNERYSLHKNELASVESDAFIYNILTRERSTVRRFKNDSKDNDDKNQLFSFDEIFFNENAGFYFIIRFFNDDIIKKIEAVIRLLGDEGIGADRNYGRGVFELSDRIELNDLLNIPEQNTKKFISLSLYCPKKSELPHILENSKYDFAVRKGWITQSNYLNYRKKALRMFIEGSEFSTIENCSVYGNIHDITPDSIDLKNKIYRNGFAFSISLS